MHWLVSLSVFSYEENCVDNNTAFLGLTDIKNEELAPQVGNDCRDSCI